MQLPDTIRGTALAIPVLIFIPGSGGAILGIGCRIWHATAFTPLAVRIAVDPFRWARAAGAACLCALAETRERGIAKRWS